MLCVLIDSVRDNSPLAILPRYSNIVLGIEQKSLTSASQEKAEVHQLHRATYTARMLRQSIRKI